MHIDVRVTILLQNFLCFNSVAEQSLPLPQPRSLSLPPSSPAVQQEDDDVICCSPESPAFSPLTPTNQYGWLKYPWFFYSAWVYYKLQRRKLSTEDVLRMLSHHQLLNSEELKIDVWRKFILKDALREGHKPKFSSKKLLKVKTSSPKMYILVYICFLIAYLSGHICRWERSWYRRTKKRVS